MHRYNCELVVGQGDFTLFEQTLAVELELEGHGGSSGTAIPGEIWSVPAGRRYHCHAQGDTISYAVAEFGIEIDGERTRGELKLLAGARAEKLLSLVTHLVRVIKS